jgi:excisionase family DNA binding protein
MHQAPRHTSRVVSESARRPQPPAAPSITQRRAQPEPHLTASDVMTAVEVATLLGVAVSTVHHWARERAIPSRKIGRRRLFVRSRIEAMLLSDDG